MPLIYDEHTAETRIYYALDLGNTYRLLDEKLIRKENLDLSAVRKWLNLIFALCRFHIKRYGSRQ